MKDDRAKLRLIPSGESQPTPGNVAIDRPARLHDDNTRPRPARLDSVRLLSLDAHGRVLDWISWQDAACLYARDAVTWTLGEPCLSVHGGVNRVTGQRTVLDVHPIIAARGHARAKALNPTPALSNPALFARDQHLCLYCEIG